MLSPWLTELAELYKKLFVEDVATVLELGTGFAENLSILLRTLKSVARSGAWILTSMR